MHAIRLHEFGPPANLRWEEVPDPEPGPGQVRIEVAVAGIHLLDTMIRAGTTGGPFPLPALPQVPGREVAGVVDAVGADVAPGWLGRRVVAHLGQASGGYAELAVVGASSLHALADHVRDDEAVAMIGTGRTTLAILDAATPHADDAVLVLAAAGGIGTLLVQAAREAGALVIGAAGGPAKVEHVRGHGAHFAVDSRQPGWPDEVARALTDAGRSLTLVFDGVGGADGRAALELLASGGRIVLYGASSGVPTQLTTADLFGQGRTAIGSVGARLVGRPDVLRRYEEAALAALTEGRLTPVVERFPLRDAAAAHEALEGRTTIGKVVLVR